MGTLICTTPPQPPFVAPAGNVTAVRVGADAARVAWATPQFLAGSGVYAGARITAYPGRRSVVSDSMSFSHLFGGLAPGTTYTFTVTILTTTSESAESSPSNAVAIQQPLYVPPRSQGMASTPSSPPTPPAPPPMPRPWPPPKPPIALTKYPDGSFDVYEGGKFITRVPPNGGWTREL